MPVVVNCDCGKQLRVADEHVGKRIRCPGCGEAVLVEESKPSAAAKKPAAAPAPAAAAGMLTFSCECGKKMQAKAEFAGRTVKCPECGEAVKVPKESDDAPARKSSPDGDEDVPVSKRLDALMSGKSQRKSAAADDDDEDDRPSRGRRAADDEDDEDDRPTKGKKGKKSGKGGGSSMPMILIACGAGLLLLIGLLIAWMFMGGGGASSDMALVPANAGGFVTVRVADLLGTDIGKEALASLPPEGKKAMEETESKLGLKLADLERVTGVVMSLDGIGPGMGGGKEPDAYFICTTTKPLDQAKVLESIEAKDVKPVDHKGKQVYEKGPGAVYFHSDKMVVFGNAAGVRRAIDQVVNPVTTGPLSKITSQVGRHHIMGGMGIPPQMAAMKGAMPPDFAAIGDVQQLMIASNVRGKSMEVEFTGMFPDSTKAGSAKTAIDGVKAMLPLFAANLPPEARKGLDNLNVSQSGSNVVISTRGDVDTSMFKNALGNLGPIGRVGVAGDRMKDSNNLKQIALAFHVMNDAMGQFNWAIYGQGAGPQRQPLLSWRVAILPYIEQDALYKQIRINEPWNSTHNSQFHNQMPKIFEVPGRTAPPGRTYYQVFVAQTPGTNALFERGQPNGRRLAQITDGSSNTALVTEGAISVNWMEPADIAFFPGANGFSPGGRVGGRFPEGFNMALCDGSVRFIPRTINPRDLQGLITASGGEVVNLP